MPIIHVDHVPSELWEVHSTDDNKFRLIELGGSGRYKFNDRKTVQQAVLFLDPRAIYETLNPNQDCTCLTRVEEGKCHHRFSYRAVQHIRAQWITSESREDDMVRQLQSLRENHDGARKCRYAFGTELVCRTWFRCCLDISNEQLNRMSALVLNKRSPERIRSFVLSPQTAPRKADVGRAFWRMFFGEQSSSSGDGHRYYPVNLPIQFIYYHFFYRWWLVNRHKWVSYENEDKESRRHPTTPIPFRLPREDMPVVPVAVPDALGHVPAVPGDVPARPYVCQSSPPLTMEHKYDSGEEPTSGSDAGLEVESEDDDPALLGALSQEDKDEMHRTQGFPSLTSFRRSRNCDEFKDVKKREKHFHARCREHAHYRKKILRHFNNPEKKAKYVRLLNVHQDEVRKWRHLEKSLQLDAKNTPGEVTSLSYDDTSTLGFPRTTNRPIKGDPYQRVLMVPFNLTNHGTSESIYIYHFKHKWLKGGNRLPSILYHVLARIKRKTGSLTNAERLQKQCRRLVLIGDNYIENKNNTLFAFLSELVIRGWYDDIELVYGPVGHTHNGNDAVHFVHNQLVGNYVAITPAEYFENYAHVWSPKTRPVPIIMETQYDFKQRYVAARKLAGFVVSKTTKTITRAFKFQAVFDSGSRGCELFTKESPVDRDWRGMGFQRGGFTILPQKLPHAPAMKPPEQTRIERCYLNAMESEKFVDYCKTEGRFTMHANLMDMARNLVVPSLGELSQDELMALPEKQRRDVSGYGTIERIGVAGSHTFVVPFLREHEFTEESFWDVGSAPTPVVPQMPAVAASPAVRYKSDKRKPSKPKKAPKRKTNRVTQSVYPDIVPATCVSSADEEEIEEKEPEQSRKAPLPEHWPVARETITAGTYVVVELQFDDGQKGVSVAKVHINVLLAPIIFW
jgi:hypothetical protein